MMLLLYDRLNYNLLKSVFCLFVSDVERGISVCIYVNVESVHALLRIYCTYVNLIITVITGHKKRVCNAFGRSIVKHYITNLQSYRCNHGNVVGILSGNGDIRRPI
jgi:hypothetical protein